MKFPSIKVNGKEYWQIGCTECRRSDWTLYTDNVEVVAKCSCGHIGNMNHFEDAEHPLNTGAVCADGMCPYLPCKQHPHCEHMKEFQ